MKNAVNLMSVITFLALFSFVTISNAQKIAYIVSEEIVPEMPAYKKAKSEVEAYGKQLQKILERFTLQLRKKSESVMLQLPKTDSDRSTGVTECE